MLYLCVTQNGSDVENFKKIVKAIQSSKNVSYNIIIVIFANIFVVWVAQGLKVGIFTKDNFTGDFVDGWKKELKDANLEMVKTLLIIRLCSCLFVHSIPYMYKFSRDANFMNHSFSPFL